VRGKETELRRQIQDLDGKLAALPEVQRKISMLDAGIDAASSQYKELKEQAVASDVNRASAADYGVQMLSPAVNAHKNQKGDLVRMALGPILALMAGVGLAFYLENMDHSLQNRDDIERHLEIPVLASFPDVDLKHEGIETKPRRSPFQKQGRGKG